MGDVYRYATLATCAYMAWVVWSRRWTFQPGSEDAALLERSITIGLAELGIGIFLATPLSEATFGVALHELTGHSNLNDFLSDCFLVGAVAGIGLSVFSRIGLPIDTLRTQFKQNVERPMTITFPIALALFWQSPNARLHWSDFFDAPTDGWLDAYWTLMSALTIWLLGRVAWALLGLRRDPRNRPVACLYCVASIAGIALCIFRIISTWEDIPCKAPIWWAYCIIAGLFGYSAQRAWQKKVDWITGEKSRQL